MICIILISFISAYRYNNVKIQSQQHEHIQHIPTLNPTSITGHQSKLHQSCVSRGLMGHELLRLVHSRKLINTIIL